MLFYHAGEPLAVHMMDHQGELTTAVLGLDLAAGQVVEEPGTPQVPAVAVPGGTWFTRLVDSGEPDTAYSLFRWIRYQANQPPHTGCPPLLSKYIFKFHIPEKIIHAKNQICRINFDKEREG